MESKESKSKPKGNPNSIPHFLHRKLESLRSLAMQRLKQSEYRRKITQAEYAALLPLIAGLPPAFQDQIWRDLKTYNLYDALAMWLDPVYGLASYYPAEFVVIGEKFLGVVDEPVEKPSLELVEVGISGHIGSYDVFISGDNVAVVEDWKGGKAYRKSVKGLADFVKKAGANLRLGWAKFPDFEVIYIYNIADENFGYAFNIHVPDLSEWGYAPFEVRGVKPESTEKSSGHSVKEEIGASDERINARFVVTYDLKEMARVGTEAQARDLMLEFQRERGWYPPALTTFPIETWNQIQQGSLEGWKQVPMMLRPHAEDLNKLVLDNLKQYALESQYIDDPTVPSGKRLVTTKRGRSYGELKSWWQMQKTAYPLEWFEGTLNALQARRLIKRYVNRCGVEVVELVEPAGVSVRHGVEISGIPEKVVAKPLREIAGELDQAGFEQLVFKYMDEAKKDWAKRQALYKRFEQLADKSNWKLAISLRKFSNLQEAVETAAAISWYHGGVDFRVVGPNEIDVWSKGYYFYTGGA